jgi:hypothetical protein
LPTLNLAAPPGSFTWNVEFRGIIRDASYRDITHKLIPFRILSSKVPTVEDFVWQIKWHAGLGERVALDLGYPWGNDFPRRRGEIERIEINGLRLWIPGSIIARGRFDLESGSVFGFLSRPAEYAKYLARMEKRALKRREHLVVDVRVLVCDSKSTRPSRLQKFWSLIAEDEDMLK